MRIPTLDQVTRWSPEERLRVRERASAMRTPLGDETVALIDGSGLPMRTGGGMSADHPIYREMEDVVWSQEGKTSALEAVKAGQPAMAGVDPLLQRRMGSRYSADQQGTLNAGFIVAEMMRVHGYEPKGSAALPPGCVARTAALYRLKRPLR